MGNLDNPQWPVSSSLFGLDNPVVNSVMVQSSWTCPEIWDGVDFTRCARERYIANVPLLIAALGAAGVAIALLRRTRREPVSTSALLTPDADNLARLEASVLVGEVAGTLLPELDLDEVSRLPDSVETQDANGQAKTTLPARESEKVINMFLDDIPPAARRWARVYRTLAIGGAAAWLGAELVVFVFRGTDWRQLIFPAFIFILSFLPSAPVIPLLTLHLFPTVLLIRSALICAEPDHVALVPELVHILYWAALVSVPYYDDLDRMLAGGVCRGGIGIASGAPKHIEDPTSAFSRGTYFFMLPYLWKHYFSPLTLDDIPSLREDDGSAASAGAFRTFQAQRDAQYAEKHDGEKRPRNLPKDLLLFFVPQLKRQVIFAYLFIFVQYLPPYGLRLLLQYINDREESEQPAHVAVVYVAMMAFGQTVGVTLYGQQLMLGRRVGVRMRAIIISEVFAKALRRLDRSGAVKSKEKKAAGSASGSSDDEAGVNGKSAAAAAKDGAKDKLGSSDGKIANLVSVDAFQISEIFAYIAYLASCPFAIVVNAIMLHSTLGPAAFAGVAVMVAFIPVQWFVSRLYTIFQKRLMAATDRRLDAVTEVISFIKLIKYNSWQDKFFDRMADARKHELSVLGQRFALVVFGGVVAWGTPVLVTAAAFGVHVLVLKQPLTADRAFSSLILFNMLRDPLAIMQDTVTRLLQAYTSCMRIQDFLEEPDTLKYKQLSVPGPSDPKIGFRDALFSYPGQEGEADEDDEDEDAQPFHLGELDLSFPPGQLSLVTGPVGSGKTTLILSLLGETVLLKGKVFMPDDHANRDICPVGADGYTDTAAFCAQTAWLIGATIRENITFGAPWDPARYAAVVDACALQRDFEIFDLGDATEVGEKGTTCSGGQKARIALARALYSNARTVILDDVLSAVDAQTARHIYVRVLQGPLMQGRTCILVTHAVPLVVPAAAFVVMLDDGRVVASGTPAELIASGALPDEPPTPFESERSDASTISTVTAAAAAAAEAGEADGEVIDRIEVQLDGEDHDALVTKKKQDTDEAAALALAEAQAKLQAKALVTAETTGEGSVMMATYGLYFASMGGAVYWVIMFVAFVGTQAVQVLTNAWVKEWSNAYDNPEESHVARMRTWAISQNSTGFYLGVYLAISVLYLFGIGTRMALTFMGSLHASNRIYAQLLKRILGAKMRFFDSTPSGRIMNRLSKDMASIDGEAAEILALFVNCVLACLAVLVVVIYSTPAFVFTLAAIILMYWFVGSLYVTTSRELKRYDSVTRSPLFVSFSEALVGMATIRSYGDSARFMRKLLGEIDVNTRCFWYLWQSNRVLNNLSNFVGTLVTVSAATLALQSPNMSAAAAGLSITYALSFTDFVLWIVRLYASAEMTMNSVERVSEYLELDVEEEDKDRGIEPPAYWPSRDGSVVVTDLTCKYAPQLDPVLRGVSFTIGPREKIGVCGRTGSGKSTLALSFFRFLHQEGGSIVIDGLDISKLSLSTLRSRLTILPQEAQLFSGTIRDNMDPFNQHEDYEIWEALRQCGLGSRTPAASRAASRAPSRVPSRAASRKDLTKVANTDAGSDADSWVEERVVIRSLDEPVAVGGKNFSQGQRQLLALARGLLKLRASSFLIMDESTANLDHATDTTIQNVIRTGLKDTQMVVIAHRLMTVCGLDKILVLDHGQVVEFGTPWELMQDERGSFRDLCRQSGEEAQLFELAKSVHERKQRGEDV